MSRRRTKTVRGFSLIEVLFAIFLASICAMILAASMPVANNSRARADLYNKATSLAQKQLEAISGLGYANATPAQLKSFNLIDSATPVGTNTYSFSNVDIAQLDNPAQVLPNGSGTVEVSQVDLDLRKVVVTVNWVDRGRNRSLKLGTLIANL